MEKRAYTETALAISLVPRQLLAFQCCTKNSGMAWYAKSSALRIGGKEGRNNLIFAFGQVKGQQISESSRLQQLRDKATLIVTECTTILLASGREDNILPSTARYTATSSSVAVKPAV